MASLPFLLLVFPFTLPFPFPGPPPLSCPCPFVDGAWVSHGHQSYIFELHDVRHDLCSRVPQVPRCAARCAYLHIGMGHNMGSWRFSHHSLWYDGMFRISHFRNQLAPNSATHGLRQSSIHATHPRSGLVYPVHSHYDLDDRRPRLQKQTAQWT